VWQENVDFAAAAGLRRKRSQFMRPINVLLLNCSPAGSIARQLREALTSNPCYSPSLRRGEMSVTAADIKSAMRDLEIVDLIRNSHPDVILLTLSQSLNKRARSLLPALKKAPSARPVIVVAETGEPERLYEWLELGAGDFITPPLKTCELFPRIWRAVDYKEQSQRPEQKPKERFGLHQLIGESQAFRVALQKIPLIAQCDAQVLISGETGTGKEMCARAIHYLSPRTRQPFAPVNCGAIPTELIENELFGHHRGAFTDASGIQTGVIHEAEGGTLFLDEIDSLPPPAQVKFLRFLQEKEYRPLGSAKARKADVRVIAAVNSDLEEAVRAGRLRQDLYYRLNVVPLRLPPLRERREDIPLLADHFLKRYADAFHRSSLSLSSDAFERLSRHDWPGNVRELEHLIERAAALAEGSVIRDSDLDLPDNVSPPSPAAFREAKAQCVSQFERAYILELLQIHHGNITKAAKIAKKNRRAFWELIRKHGIDAQSFKGDAPVR
jgi:two-component system, NtrC family, response regulator GlrR